MASRVDQERIRALLTEAITVLCKNGLAYNSDFCIDGLLGITVDNDDIFLVKINEQISRHKQQSFSHRQQQQQQQQPPPPPQQHHQQQQNKYSVNEPSGEPCSDQRSLTSTSPDRTSSISQPPTPQSSEGLAPVAAAATSTGQYGREQASRKRHWNGLSPVAAKRCDSGGGGGQGSSEADAIVIKEEVLTNSELQQFGLLAQDNNDGGAGGGGGGDDDADRSDGTPHPPPPSLAQSTTGRPDVTAWPHLAAVSRRQDTSASCDTYDDSQVEHGKTDRPQEQKVAVTNYRHEPLDFTLSDEKRLLQGFSVATTAEVTKAALFQHQKALLQAMATAQQQVHQQQVQHQQQQSAGPGIAGGTAAGAPGGPAGWPHLSPDYLRLQHKLSRPYVCEECGKTFTSSCGRRRHMDTHRGIYPYRCDHCGKGFTASNNLKAHLTLHTHVNNFKCDICGLAFRYSQYLKDHVRKEHLDDIHNINNASTGGAGAGAGGEGVFGGGSMGVRGGEFGGTGSLRVGTKEQEVAPVAPLPTQDFSNSRDSGTDNNEA